MDWMFSRSKNNSGCRAAALQIVGHGPLARFWVREHVSCSCSYWGPAPCYLATLLEWMHEYNVSQAVPRTLILGVEDRPWLSTVANQDEGCLTKRECNHINDDFCAETFKWWHSWFDRIFYGAIFSLFLIL